MSTPAIAKNTSTGSNSSTSTPASNLKMTPSDFLNMMITQLKNQDPLNPTSSSELMQQMSQIGQIQSTTTLQSTLQTFAQQTSISSASSMIGKMVTGLDANSKPVTGLVNSVQVQSDGISLQLDNGQSLQLAQVQSISPGPTGTTAGTGTTPPAGTP